MLVYQSVFPFTCYVGDMAAIFQVLHDFYLQNLNLPAHHRVQQAMHVSHTYLSHT